MTCVRMYKWEAGDVGISGQNEEEERKEGRKEDG
jgi:hypothetical protein